MAEQAENQALVERITRGDREALGELLLAQQSRLYNIILRMVRQHDDALELTQQTMLQVIEHIDGFKGKSTVTTWMTRIAMNAALSHLRKRRARRTSSLDGDETAGGDEPASLAGAVADHREPSPDSRIESQERAAMVTAALDAIDDDHRAVLVLRDVEGLDYQRMAEVLEVAVGTVKSRLFRARLALRTQLARRETAATEPTRAKSHTP